MKADFPPDSCVEILLPRPFDHGFDYLVPSDMTLSVGEWVEVPFGKKTMIGVVWKAAEGKIAAEKCKKVLQKFTDFPPLSKAFIEFISWSARYTLMEKGLFLKMAMPIPKALTGRINQKTEKPHTCATHVYTSVTLREDQAIAAQAILDVEGFAPIVLDGVTGSGKTEVYFEVMAKLLAKESGQMLVLLPEIALTHQWITRFTARFGFAPVLWHSSVSLAARKKHWRQIASGTARVIVGARSALYLPYANLHLLIVDEEHENAYKQEDGVLYHARDMAVARASKEKITVILSSATPSLETIANVKSGKYRFVTLEDRHGAFEYPEVTLIDLRHNKPDRGDFIAPILRQAMMKTLAHGHQVLLFLNRRGYAPLLLCRHCGYRFSCSHCSSWLVSHQYPPRLECHHCGARKPAPPQCPECQHADELVACGPGVERIAEEVKRFLPNESIALLTSDAADLSVQIEKAIAAEASILIGTQLLAKGHHFPHLALVGVIDADLGLGGGDLRASEHIYQLLHQIAGRAGREKAAGKVYLQTVQPEHPVMQAMKAGKREDFNALELSVRERGGWPPYGRLAALILDGKREIEVRKIAESLARGLAANEQWHVLGPAPAPLSKLQNQYRFRILLKADKLFPMQQVLSEWRSKLSLSHAVRLRIDIDPYNFL